MEKNLFLCNLELFAKEMYPKDERAQKLYILSGLQKKDPDQYTEYLTELRQDTVNFPELAGNKLSDEMLKAWLLEKQGNWKVTYH